MFRQNNTGASLRTQPIATLVAANITPLVQSRHLSVGKVHVNGDRATIDVSLANFGGAFPFELRREPARWRLNFMREGGVLALSLLHSAELELTGSEVVVSMGGTVVAIGALVQNGAGVSLVFDGEPGNLLAGDLSVEESGQRSLSNAWATFTLDPLVEPDRRVKLCASEGSGIPTTIRSLTRRVACEAHEIEVAPSGHGVR
jgi:hypothetical protein